MYMLRFALLMLSLCLAIPLDAPAQVAASHAISIEAGQPEQEYAEGQGPAVQLQTEAPPAGEEASTFDEVSVVRDQMFFTALLFGFGLLHLILFAFLPGQKSNFYYALFLILLSAATYFDFEHFLADTPAEAIDMLRLQRLALSLSVASGLRFFYELFAPSLPRHVWPLMVGLVVAGAIATLDPVGLFFLVEVLVVIALVDIVRVLVRAVKSHREDAWIVASGFLFFAAFALYDVLLDVGLIRSIAGIVNAYPYGIVGLLTATSAYLARDIARTNARVVEREREVQRQEAERQLLSAEVARKTAELSEARALQSSMLPRSVPTLPDVEIAVHMETATEVGGDYYDFHVEPDGTLVAAIGDATGHGTRAGLMVALAKSLFQSSVPIRDIPAFFNRCTDILKPMNLGNNYMAMALVRIRDHTMTASAAGMPPILIYRSRAGRVEELTLKGMPLGAFHDFPYQQTSVELESGDMVVLLSDGLSELFNPRREMLGMERIGTALKEVGSATPDAIADHLRGTIAGWRDGSPQDDDITFVILKKR